MDRVGKVTQSIESAFKAHAAKLHARTRLDIVVGDPLTSLSTDDLNNDQAMLGVARDFGRIARINNIKAIPFLRHRRPFPGRGFPGWRLRTMQGGMRREGP